MPLSIKSFLIIAVAFLITSGANDSLADNSGFVWQERESDRVSLYWNGKPAMQYVMPTLDNSSKESRMKTYKPFHHVYSPDGETLLTKGPGGLFPHHRGLFYGFNKITYGDGKKCDTWHCPRKEYQAATGIKWVKTLDSHNPAKGKVGDYASHGLSIEWHGREGEIFAHEHRTLSIAREEYHGVEGWIIDFSSKLSPFGELPIHLDGDPQHAGFQFRASQLVPDKTADQTYYLRTDGKGKPGDYRNWDHNNPDSLKNVECVNRPWNGLCIVIDDKRYTILYMDNPNNPKPARYSERDYGRFGSYFVADATTESPLMVHYRLWIQEGEMTVEQCEEILKACVQKMGYPFGSMEMIEDETHQRN